MQDFGAILLIDILFHMTQLINKQYKEPSHNKETNSQLTVE